MEYSKIVSVEVTNFMAFSHAKVVFDEDNNIINLKGYNGSGKTTIHRAIMVCLANMFARDQVKLIKHDEEYFRVVVSFDDGVTIVRDKYINGQSLYEMYQGSNKLFSTKVGNKLTRVDGVPDCIEAYLGLCTTKFGCLNFLSRDTKMWLVETAGSENYYSLHEALKTEEIARASTLLNSDKNKLGGEIAEIEAELQEATILLNNCFNVSEEVIIALEDRESFAQSISSMCEWADNACRVADEYSGLVVPPSVGVVDEGKYKSVSDILRTVDGFIGLPVLPSVDALDTSRVSSVSSMYTVSSELSGMCSLPNVTKVGTDKMTSIFKLLKVSSALESELVDTVAEDINTVSYSMMKSMLFIEGTLSEYEDATKALEDTNEELKRVSSELEKVVESSREKGIKFVKCDNCGTYMEVGAEDGI